MIGDGLSKLNGIVIVVIVGKEVVFVMVIIYEELIDLYYLVDFVYRMG